MGRSGDCDSSDGGLAGSGVVSLTGAKSELNRGRSFSLVGIDVIGFKILLFIR